MAFPVHQHPIFSRPRSWLLYFDLFDELDGIVAAAGGENILRAEYLVPWTHAVIGGRMDADQVLRAARTEQPYALGEGELPYFLEDATFTVECGTTSSTVSLRASMPQSWRPSPNEPCAPCPFPAYDFRGLNRVDLLVGGGLLLMFPDVGFRHRCSFDRSSPTWTLDGSDPDTLLDSTSRVVQALRQHWRCEFKASVTGFPGLDEYERLSRQVELGQLMPSALASTPNLRRIHQRVELMNP